MIIRLPGGQLRNQEALAIYFSGPIMSRLWPTKESALLERDSDSVTYAFTKYDYHPSSLLITASGKSILSLMIAPYGATLKDKPILKEVSSWAVMKDKEFNVSAELTEDYKDRNGVFLSSIPIDSRRPFAFAVEPLSLGSQLTLMMNGFIRKLVGE